MTAAAADRCPRCDVGELGDHCPSPTCWWKKCRSRLCLAVLDQPNRRGFHVGAEGAVTILRL